MKLFLFLNSLIVQLRSTESRVSDLHKPLEARLEPRAATPRHYPCVDPYLTKKESLGCGPTIS